jgi:hypothetical protein
MDKQLTSKLIEERQLYRTSACRRPEIRIHLEYICFWRIYTYIFKLSPFPMGRSRRRETSFERYGHPNEARVRRW